MALFPGLNVFLAEEFVSDWKFAQKDVSDFSSSPAS